MSRLGLAILAAFASGIVSAQTPFRVDVRLINLSVSVRDSSGRLVPNLTQDDFEILEDGVPQKIAFFARSNDVPLNLGLVVDISGSQGPFVKAHQKDLKVFLESVLSKRDRAFLLCFGNHPRLVTDFTSSPKQLVDALDGFVHTGNKSMYPLVGPDEIRTAGTAFFDAVYHSSNQMFQNVERGRKALILFSDGEDNSSAHHELEAIETAQANDVLLFCVRYTEVRNGRWNARNKYGRAVMERMALETGGGDYDALEKGLADNFRQIGEHLRSSYELAYHSSNPDSDGTFRKIKVRARQPGLTVRSKTGYYSRPS
jgi:Ca-activated chloride channel family protein